MNASRRRILVLLLLLVSFLANNSRASNNDDDEVCSYTTGGTAFDLSSLRVTDLSSKSYNIDGVDASQFSYIVNFCAPVTPAGLPRVCDGQQAAVLQYKAGGAFNGECYRLGSFSSSAADTWSLIDKTDPSKGVSLYYDDGQACSKGSSRSTTVDVYCANTEAEMKSAGESSARVCSYHIIMESYYGCPTSCKISSEGLCSGHGSCAYEASTDAAYCKCDAGYSGDDCSSGSGSAMGDSLDNDIISSLPYMYAADTDQKKWKGNLLLVICGMLLALAAGVVYQLVVGRMRAATGYSQIPQGEVVESISSFDGGGGKDFESVFIHKGGGGLGI